MYVTYRREYENFTHLPSESIDALFQRFTVVVNNMRANVDVLSYDDHDRAIKLLHSLDHTVCGGKFETIVESEKYDTLTIDELFSKLMSAKVDRGMTAKMEGPTDFHNLALIGGSKGKSNTNPSTRMFSLSYLISVQDEEFDMLGEDELALLTRRFELALALLTSQELLSCGRAGATHEPRSRRSPSLRSSSCRSAPPAKGPRSGSSRSKLPSLMPGQRWSGSASPTRRRRSC
jgi:hypothetical protein